MSLSKRLISTDAGGGFGEDGKYIVFTAGANEYDLYYSSDSGQSFTLKPNFQDPSAGNILGLCISADGQYIYAATQYGSGIRLSTNGGNTWSRPYINDVFESACCDSTGQYVYAGSINNKLYKSSNYGATFSLVYTSTDDCEALATSYDGSKLYAYFKNDEFRYWSDIKNSNTSASRPLFLPGWRPSMCTSADGQRVNSTKQTGVAVGTNTGLSVTNVTWQYQDSYAVEMSGTGQHQIVAASQTSRMSNDYGVNWFNRTCAGMLYGIDSRDCGINYSGQIMSLVSGRGIAMSYDFGDTWTETGSYEAITKVAVSKLNVT